ncbi:hypothetical protein BC826DRAFT_1192194 [Russula brevipes]|nr:hypothetical protein BC826DRAFT_1192194 [Russula brevipes]
MPGYENLYLQNPDSGSQSQCSANDGLIALPPIELDTFMLHPTVEQILATINTLVQPQSEENVSSSSTSPDPQPIDSTPAFNFDDFVKDFGVSASQEPTEDTTAIQTCTEDQNLSVSQSSSATPTSHFEGAQSPMPSFYVATPSPTSTEPTSPPVAKDPCVPPPRRSQCCCPPRWRQLQGPHGGFETCFSRFRLHCQSSGVV